MARGDVLAMAGDESPTIDDMQNDADVLILGGGVIGLACAHYLLQAGRSVHILERGRIGGATSHGNCGTITPSHAPPLAAPGTVLKALKWMASPDAPLYVKPRLDPTLAYWLLRFALRCNRRDWRQAGIAKAALLHQSRSLVEDLATRFQLDCEFHASGVRNIYRDVEEFERACRELPALAELGIASAIVAPDILAGDEPALRPGMAGAIEFPDDAHLRPDRYSAELARLVREQGGIIEENVAVTGFIATNRSRLDGVNTAQGVRRGRDVLAAFGPWSPAVLRQLGLKIPIQPGKGYSITYSRPTLAPRTPIVLKERSVCVTTWESGYRLGSTMEFSGYDDSLNRRRLDALERAANEYLREPVGPVKQEEWFGWRPMTWDDLPILGAAPGWKNLWLATGHGMLGVTLSAGTGQLMADLICRRECAVDPRPFRADRF